MTATKPNGQLGHESDGEANSEAHVTCVPTVGDTRYDSGALSVRNVSDGVEFKLQLPIGPVFMWVSHDDAEKLAGVADPKPTSNS